MSLTTNVGLLAVAGALSLSAAGFAGDEQDARIAELEAEVAALKATVTGEAWMTEERADEIRGVVQDVLADADARGSLLQSGMTSGYDGGFMVGSADGAFSLKLNGLLQARYIYNQLSTPSGSGVDENRAGFELSRTKLLFSGHVVSPEWKYMIETNFDRDGGDLELLDAWIMHDFGEGFGVLVGQYKVPISREWWVGDESLQVIERSLVNYNLNGGRTQGVVLDYSADMFHLMGSYNDGAGTANTGWEDYDTEYAFTFRGDLLFMGNWSQFADMYSMPGSENGLLWGVGVHYQNDEYGTPTPDPKTDVWIVTSDLSWEANGWSLFGSVTYADVNAATGEGARQWGAVVQGGFFFTDKVEGYARYEYLDFDDIAQGVYMPGIDDLSILTIGVNAYYSANVKASADFGYGFDAVSGASGNGITGWRNDVGDEDGQWVLRTQLQLGF